MSAQRNCNENEGTQETVPRALADVSRTLGDKGVPLGLPWHWASRVTDQEIGQEEGHSSRTEKGIQQTWFKPQSPT